MRPPSPVKTSGSPYRITFDLHRAFSLWAWACGFRNSSILDEYGNRIGARRVPAC